MERFAKTGDFCPHPNCSEYGKLQDEKQKNSGKFTVLMAGAFLSIVPLLIIFFIAQKQFIEGIALSGVKI